MDRGSYSPASGLRRDSGGFEAMAATRPELLLHGAQAVPWSISPDGPAIAIFPDQSRDRLRHLDAPAGPLGPLHPKPGKPEPFLRTKFHEACPSFSPDGRWVAYFSNDRARTRSLCGPPRARRANGRSRAAAARSPPGPRMAASCTTKASTIGSRSWITPRRARPLKREGRGSGRAVIAERV